MKPSRWMATLKKTDEAVAIDVVPLENGRYAVTLDGVTHQVDALALPHGAVSILIDGDSHAIELEEKGDQISVSLKGQLTHVDLVDERRARLRQATAGFTAEGKQTVCAPMPGKIIKVLVKLGDDVSQGQGLVVMEAMKMENELKSPKAGKVASLFIAEGAVVENGAQLLVVE